MVEVVGRKQDAGVLRVEQCQHDIGKSLVGACCHMDIVLHRTNEVRYDALQKGWLTLLLAAINDIAGLRVGSDPDAVDRASMQRVDSTQAELAMLSNVNHHVLSNRKCSWRRLLFRRC